MNALSTNFTGLGLTGALRAVSARLAAHGISAVDVEARMLLFAATHTDRTAMLRDPDRPLTPEGAEQLVAFLIRRLAGEPATRIVGQRAFWTLDLRVTADVLDPRPDSETIVEAALAELGDRRREPLRILDLGTGSGALLLALLSECPRATGLGIDLSEAACAIAKANAELNGLANRTEIRQGRWMEGLEESFDLILSNPPYIESADIPGLSIEVRAHDPLLALDGGADGLTAYRDIVAALPSCLTQGGIAVLELGMGQANAVTALGLEVGLEFRGLRRDLGGIERALVFRSQPQAR